LSKSVLGFIPLPPLVLPDYIYYTICHDSLQGVIHSESQEFCLDIKPCLIYSYVMTEKQAKKTRGNPSLYDGVTPRRSIRFPAPDWELIQRAADTLGVSVSELVRSSAVSKAKRVLK